MRCAACGHDDAPHNPGCVCAICTRWGSARTFEPFVPVAIVASVMTHAEGEAPRFGTSFPTSNLLACPKCRTVRLGD